MTNTIPDDEYEEYEDEDEYEWDDDDEEDDEEDEEVWGDIPNTSKVSKVASKNRDATSFKPTDMFDDWDSLDNPINPIIRHNIRMAEKGQVPYSSLLVGFDVCKEVGTFSHVSSLPQDYLKALCEIADHSKNLDENEEYYYEYLVDVLREYLQL